MESLWMQTSSLPPATALHGDIKTDVLIIGGGLSGLLCAYMLRQEGVNCTVIEAGRIGGGVSGHTTAKITSQHGLIYSRLLSTYGKDRARLYYEANEQALDRYRELCNKVDSDFEEQDAYVYSCDAPDVIERELKALQIIGVPASFSEHLPLPFQTVGAVRFPRQAQFHPLRLAVGLVGDIPIYEHTRAIAFDGQAVRTEHGKITAEHIVVTTHFPLFNKHGMFSLKLYQHRSYVMALKGAPSISGMYVDEQDTGLSFRCYKDHLLLGGGAHRTGKTGGGWQELEVFAKKHYPRAVMQTRWATQDCMSLDGMPYIGQYAKSTPRLYVATGYNKWGMTSAMTAATMLCDRICDRRSPYEQLFSPSRSVWHPQLARNLFETARHFVVPVTPRCPHLGCALSWNREERSWDCPCHGSRFAENGRVLDGPANADKQV